MPRWCKKCHVVFQGPKCPGKHAIFMYTKKLPPGTKLKKAPEPTPPPPPPDPDLEPEEPPTEPPKEEELPEPLGPAPTLAPAPALDADSLGVAEQPVENAEAASVATESVAAVPEYGGGSETAAVAVVGSSLVCTWML